jgi:hypothetical protein
MQTFCAFLRAFGALSSQMGNQKWISVSNITQFYVLPSTKLEVCDIEWNYFVLLNRFYASALRKIQVTKFIVGHLLFVSTLYQYEHSLSSREVA